MMSKFKVGDRVRVIKSGKAPGGSFHGAGIGEEFTLTRVDGSFVSTKVWDFYPHEIEHIYTACAAAEVDNLADEYGAPKAASKDGFKVGDRVRFITAQPNYGAEPYSGELIIKEIGGGDWGDDVYLIYADYPRGHYTQIARLVDIEHVATAPALRIEAGKFYKTRDGRKVGPAAHYEPGKDYGWPWDVGDSILRRPDGKAGGTYPDTYDLIAEWTDISIADIVVRHSASGTAIVAVLENGQPRPATRPFVHTTASAAETEANRLARANPGKEFGVYTLGAVAKVEKTYDHEWQRLAAGGNKIGAIKELRGMTGLFLATAKDAVEDWLRRAA